MPNNKGSRPERSIVAERVRVDREALGMTQAELAFRMDWPPERVSLIESGKRDIRADEVPRLAESLGVTVWRLYYAPGDVVPLARAAG